MTATNTNNTSNGGKSATSSGGASGGAKPQAPRANTPKSTSPPSSSGKSQRTWTDVNSSHREWNRIAESMDAYHNYFRWEFADIYNKADGGFHKDGRDVRAFLKHAQGLTRHLGAHHATEERAIFPLLARKLPMFRNDGGHQKQHHEIHAGLGRYDAYIAQTLANPSTYNYITLRVIMDSFRRVLFDHLDQEVRDLGAESLKKHGFTLDEVRNFPM